MKTRLIAALVLASLAWSNVPVMWAMMPAATQTASQGAAGAHDHACCPGLHLQLVPPIFVKRGPGGMPCDDQHPCCARQGPENPSSLPAVTNISRPDSYGSTAVFPAHTGVSSACGAVIEFGGAPPRSYFERSRVLRI